jgi:hypothetical protein
MTDEGARRVVSPQCGITAMIGKVPALLLLRLSQLVHRARRDAVFRLPLLVRDHRPPGAVVLALPAVPRRRGEVAGRARHQRAGQQRRPLDGLRPGARARPAVRGGRPLTSSLGRRLVERERDHQHRKRCIRVTRGGKTLVGAQVLCGAHAFLRNLRGRCYAFAQGVDTVGFCQLRHYYAPGIP